METDVVDTTIGATPVTLVVDTAHRADSEVTTASVLDRELRFLSGVVDRAGGSASVEENVLVIGPHRRTLRDGALIPAP